MNAPHDTESSISDRFVGIRSGRRWGVTGQRSATRHENGGRRPLVGIGRTTGGETGVGRNAETLSSRVWHKTSGRSHAPHSVTNQCHRLLSELRRLQRSRLHDAFNGLAKQLQTNWWGSSADRTLHYTASQLSWSRPADENLSASPQFHRNRRCFHASPTAANRATCSSSRPPPLTVDFRQISGAFNRQKRPHKNPLTKQQHKEVTWPGQCTEPFARGRRFMPAAGLTTDLWV